MPSIDVKTTAGGSAGKIELDDATFGITPNVAVMHQVVTAQLAAKRQGTHSTLTRAQVRGGGAKPWKQKGTGRARAGSIRAPHWSGGGVAHGPKPRDYSQRTPKKMKKLALRSALSDRAASGDVIVVDKWGFDSPSTKLAAAALANLGAKDKAVLVVLEAGDDAAARSFRNLPSVRVVSAGELNTYDVLVSDVVIFTRGNVPTTTVAPGARAPESEATGAGDTDDGDADLVDAAGTESGGPA